MSDLILPAELDLGEHLHLDYAEFADDAREVAKFRLWYVAYQCTRQELEYECNAKAMLARVQRADAGAGYVNVDDPHVTVYVRDGNGALTAAYRELVECHDDIGSCIHLDDCAYQCALEKAADAQSDYFVDAAREIVEGGKAAFNADDWCQTYGGEWADLGDDDEARVNALAWNMAYQAIDEG